MLLLLGSFVACSNNQSAEAVATDYVGLDDTCISLILGYQPVLDRRDEGWTKAEQLAALSVPGPTWVEVIERAYAQPSQSAGRVKAAAYRDCVFSRGNVALENTKDVQTIDKDLVCLLVAHGYAQVAVKRDQGVAEAEQIAVARSLFSSLGDLPDTVAEVIEQTVALSLRQIDVAYRHTTASPAEILELAYDACVANSGSGQPFEL
ncbi:hypothetical protein CAI21_07370 [Alkalilimnicola ehrlichii]|uniref:Uncharacterized protein n=1 Tax=Alkalilimnicola ehrlichii TaxID=351052 RepID=A0A3E0WWJ9_9GAMM|nr:hypothetical protein CAI21_07370 [Alkalilimnicola ehrlichii]RFA37374.1 hypothetical protein CAL65_08705 [Alkalilimnicola ehrlichii]